MESLNLDNEALFVGGRLCLDFVNTSCMRRGTPLEFIGSAGDLREWLRKAETMTGITLCDKDMEFGDEALSRAVALRSALSELVHGMIEQRPPAAQALQVVNATLRETPAYSQLDYGNTGFQESRLTSPPGDRWLAAIAQDAVDLLCRSDLSLLRECGCPTCVRVFYDTTKNHKRRWCVEKCGSAPKAAAYYRRKVARAAEANAEVSDLPAALQMAWLWEK